MSKMSKTCRIQLETQSMLSFFSPMAANNNKMCIIRFITGAKVNYTLFTLITHSISTYLYKNSFKMFLNRI